MKKESVKQTVLAPAYMRKFSCIGPECAENCCEIDWLIHIDKATYKKCRRIKDSELAPLLEKYVKRVRANRTDTAYARLKFGGRGQCPFLTGGKLCRIQEKLGEDYLNTVCVTYPRHTNKVDGAVELSGSLSCPEVAALALLNREKMEFSYFEEPREKRRAIRVTLDCRKPDLKNRYMKYFWELRHFTIGLLQNRDLRLEDRLIVLGLFVQKLQELAPGGRVEEIPGLIEKFNSNIAGGVFAESLLKMDDSLAENSNRFIIQMELLKEISDYRFKYPFVRAEGKPNTYLKCLGQFLNGIKYTGIEDMAEIGARYQEAYFKYFVPFLAENEHIFENYLVNHVFMHLLPLGVKMSVFDTYAMMVIQYALIKMLLIGMAAYQEKLDPGMVVTLVYSFTTTTENNAYYLQDVYGTLKKKGFITMPYMTILIKG